MKPWLLDLFAGAGGCTKGYQRAGFRTVGVDINPQPNYCGDEFIRDDALTVSLAGFDAIHASPPCPRYSNISKAWNGDPESHPDLVAETRRRLIESGLPYVIENVVGAPLIDPIQLCGSSFGLGVERHRLFECSFPVMGPPCAHGQQAAQFDVYEHGRWFKSRVARVYGVGGGKARDRWGEAMGIDWMTDTELAQAIPPAYTEHIGGYLMAELDARHTETRR